MKKPIEVTVYMMPSSLGSVVVITRYTNDPLTPRRVRERPGGCQFGDGAHGVPRSARGLGHLVRHVHHSHYSDSYLTDYSPLNRFG